MQDKLERNEARQNQSIFFAVGYARMMAYLESQEINFPLRNALKEVRHVRLAMCRVRPSKRGLIPRNFHQEVTSNGKIGESRNGTILPIQERQALCE